MDKNQKQQLMTGIFILSGLALLLLLLFALGLSDFFAHKVTLRTGFSESVQGLSKGSAVKYRGVQIGTVSGIYILVKENIIQIDMEIEPKYFAVGQPGSDSNTEFFNFLRSEIKAKGLRARLEMLGITGMKYIDFDYFAKPGTVLPPAPKAVGPRGVFYIPSVTSQMKDITGTLTMAVDRISRIRFERISEQLETALTGLGQLLASQEIRSTIARINDTAENLQTSSRAIASVLNESRIQTVVQQLEKNLASLNKLQQLMLHIAGESKLPQTTAAFRELLGNFSSTARDLDDSLLKLNQALESIRVLADDLSEDPASLIRGKTEKMEQK
jgi:phospholipid/cholesterol/gamma-HCH transport system substrate-binding protein/paraquat-inducible protein B